MPRHITVTWECDLCGARSIVPDGQVAPEGWRVMSNGYTLACPDPDDTHGQPRH